jgi:hypothetical protein
MLELKLNFGLKNPTTKIITKNINLSLQDLSEIKIDKYVLMSFGWKQLSPDIFYLLDLTIDRNGNVSWCGAFITNKDNMVRQFKTIDELQLLYFAIYNENMVLNTDFDESDLQIK